MLPSSAFPGKLLSPSPFIYRPDKPYSISDSILLSSAPLETSMPWYLQSLLLFLTSNCFPLAFSYFFPQPMNTAIYFCHQLLPSEGCSPARVVLGRCGFEHQAPFSAALRCFQNHLKNGSSMSKVWQVCSNLKAITFKSGGRKLGWNRPRVTYFWGPQQYNNLFEGFQGQIHENSLSVNENLMTFSFLGWIFWTDALCPRLKESFLRE